MRAPVLWVPLVALAPPQPPEAAHEVALVELQVSVEAPPLLTAVGAALMDAVGFGSIEFLLPSPHAAMSSDTQAGTNRNANRR